ncbi:hypothetical protein SCMU_18360 [Sinomonas cyclohexanicum]|uniref:DUF222 domain-containing protein n=1 Tax=Sinomonas cyclohexanicum TaxID=322009 RepID=A0ABN6FH46_SINCY|nr:hypothetical protein [Corynebacterium cyclohexanicum]BCT75994.1 hypothetical protein SCMU_18360 [Corynebacterium cyclohexanicum]
MRTEGVPSTATADPAGVTIPEPLAQAPAPEPPRVRERAHAHEEAERPYYRLTVADDEVLVRAELDSAVGDASRAWAEAVDAVAALDTRLGQLDAERTQRAAEKAERETQVAQAADAGSVDEVSAYLARIDALGRVDAAQDAIARSVAAQRDAAAPGVAARLEAVQAAQERLEAWDAAHRGKVPRTHVDLVVRETILAWSDDDDRGELNAVLLAAAIAELPDKVAERAAAAPDWLRGEVRTVEQARAARNAPPPPHVPRDVAEATRLYEEATANLAKALEDAERTRQALLYRDVNRPTTVPILETVVEPDPAAFLSLQGW